MCITMNVKKALSVFQKENGQTISEMTINKMYMIIKSLHQIYLKGTFS